MNSSLDPNLEKTELTDKYKEKWKKLSDKKKLKYIVAAYEAEVKYRKAVKDYNAEHENSIPLPKNSVISKEEFTILDKYVYWRVLYVNVCKTIFYSWRKSQLNSKDLLPCKKSIQLLK